jgi:DNA primase
LKKANPSHEGPPRGGKPINRRLINRVQHGSNDRKRQSARRRAAAQTPSAIPNGFRKSLELFNLHRVLSIGRETAIVVEEFLDAAKVHQAGYPSVVSLMGWSLSQKQEDALAEFSKVILMLDGDEAGREATKKLRRGSCGGHL